MSINYFMTARDSVEVQGVIVNLTSEFEQDAIPKTVTVNGSGASGEVYVNVSGVYDLETERFQNLNVVNVPRGFVGEVETVINTFRAGMKSDQV